MGYYITPSNATGTVYTLRERIETIHALYGNRVSDCMIANLKTRDPVEAVKRAMRYRPRITNIKVYGTCAPVKAKVKKDWSKLQAGKHQGQTIAEVMETDPKYVAWLLANCRSSKAFAKTIALFEQ
jgi:hypothetical protein